jgi:hypothetical protein
MGGWRATKALTILTVSPLIDPVMCQVVGGRAVVAQAASASQMGGLKTETLAMTENRQAMACTWTAHGTVAFMIATG